MKVKLFVTFDVDEDVVDAIIHNIENTQGLPPFAAVDVILIPAHETGTIGQRSAAIIKQDFGTTEPVEAIACVIDEVIANDVCERMVAKMQADRKAAEGIPLV